MSETIDFNSLLSNLDSKIKAVQKLISDAQSGDKQMSIGQMFQVQMAMNMLSQTSEMSTSIVSASNTVIASMARNVKA